MDEKYYYKCLLDDNTEFKFCDDVDDFYTTANTIFFTSGSHHIACIDKSRVTAIIRFKA